MLPSLQFVCSQRTRGSWRIQYQNRRGNCFTLQFIRPVHFIIEIVAKYKTDYNECRFTNSCLHHYSAVRNSWVIAYRGIQCHYGDLNASIESKLNWEVEGIVLLHVSRTENWWSVRNVVYWDAAKLPLLFDFRIDIDYATWTHIHNNILTDQYNGFVTLKDIELPDDGFDWGAETCWSDLSVIN